MNLLNSKILQPFLWLLQKTILSMSFLERVNRLMGLDEQFMEHLSAPVNKELGMIHLASVFSSLTISWGFYCFMQISVHQESISQWVWLGFFIMYLNIFQLLYSLGGYRYSSSIDEQLDWKPSIWIGILFLFVSTLSSISFATYECYLLLEHDVLPLHELIPATVKKYPFIFCILCLFSLFVSLLPVYLRSLFVESYRKYYSIQHRYTRDIIVVHWEGTTKKVNQLLGIYPSFSGEYQSPYADPPFNTKELVMGVLNPQMNMSTSEISETLE